VSEGINPDNIVIFFVRMTKYGQAIFKNHGLEKKKLPNRILR
jgi:hypothetical protein